MRTGNGMEDVSRRVAIRFQVSPSDLRTMDVEDFDLVSAGSSFLLPDQRISSFLSHVKPLLYKENQENRMNDVDAAEERSELGKK